MLPIAVMLDGTHGGADVTYDNLQTNQTFSFDVMGADLIAAGATVGQNLRLNIFSHHINWVDNLSVTLPYDPEIGDIFIQAVPGGTEVALTWMTDSGSLYGVAARRSLTLESWDNIITGVEGTGGEVTVTNPVSSDAEFYRADIQD